MPVDKPTAVARACDLLLLTVPDDMLANVVTMLAATGAIRAGPVRRAHLAAGTASRCSRPAAERRRARRSRMHPAMTFTGTDVDLDRLPGCVFGVTADAGERAARPRRWSPTSAARVDVGRRGASARSTTPASRTAPTTSSPWSPRRWSCCGAAGADDPAATLRPLLTAALDNALAYGDAALTGPIVRGDVKTVRAHLADIAATAPDDARRRTSRWPAPPPTARCIDGRLLPIRAAELVRRARRRARRRRPPRRAAAPRRRCDEPPTPVVARTRAELADAARARPVARRAAGRAGARRWARCTTGHAALLRDRPRAGRRRRTRSWSRSSSTRCSSAPGEDLDRYPRTFDADLEVCAREGVDVVFAPSVEEVYPGGDPQVTVEPGPLGTVLEGAARPGHFRGVLTVVAKLFGLVRPDVGGLRPEGLPAAGAGPPDGRGPVPGRRRGRAPRRSASRRAGAVLAQPLPRRPTSDARPP